MTKAPTAPTGEPSARDHAQRQFLTFTLGGNYHAVPIEHVLEIIEFDGMTPIPMTPDFLRGVINLRGAVVPVVDLQARFGRAQTTLGKRTCFVIVEVDHDGIQHPLGIMVDAVNEVVDVDRSRLEPAPTFGTRLRQDFVDGILNLDGRFVVVLDIRRVLSIEEMASVVGLAARGDAEEPARA